MATLDTKISTHISDFSYLARSKNFVNVADGVYACFRIPKKAFIEEVWLDVFELSAAGTVSVGWEGNAAAADPDGFIDTTLGVTTSVAVIKATDDAQPGSKGKWFLDGSGVLTVTSATNTDGSFRVFCRYSIIS